METFIAEQAIDCDYHRRGRLSCAPGPAQYEALSRRLDPLNRLFDADAHMVPRAEQQSEIGSDRFHGLMVVKRSGQLNPAQLVKALVGAVPAERRAHLFSDTLVTAIERRAGGFTLATVRGSLQADTVVVAVNAQAARLSSAGLASRVVPVASHIIVTEPLPEAMASALLPNRRTGCRQPAPARLFPPHARRLALPLWQPRLALRRLAGTGGRRAVPADGCDLPAARRRAHPPRLGLQGWLHLRWPAAYGRERRAPLHHGLQRQRRGDDELPGLPAGAQDDRAAGSASVFDQPIFPTVPLYGGSPWFLPLVATLYGLLDRKDEWRARLSQG